MRIALWVGLAAALCSAQSGEHWVGTWAASPQMRAGAPRPAAPAVSQNPVTVAQAPNGQQVQATLGIQGGVPAPRPAGPPQSFNNETIRMVVRTSIGGRRIRVHFSNTFGTGPLTIGSAHVALRAKGAEIVAGSDRELTFDGRKTAFLAQGALMISDPVDLPVPANGDLAVSVYIPGETTALTMHSVGLHTTFIKEGNEAAAVSIAEPVTATSWYFLTAVEVAAPADAAAIVAFGDSITDGTRSTVDTNNSWPSHLAQRLESVGATHLAVLNHGISGNGVLREIAGPSALARFDRDVLGMAGVKYMVVLEGINDIGQGNRAGTPEANIVTAEDIIGGYKQLIERAHTHGIQIYGATLTPDEGSGYFNDKAETARTAVNQWIRTSGAFDGVIDFDAAVRDPQNPKKIRGDYDSGDHLHPGDAGYKAMAESIDLSLFGVKAASASR